MSATVMQIIATIMLIGFFASIIITPIIGLIIILLKVHKDEDE